MILKKAVMHIVDRESGNHVFSQAEIDIEARETYLYLEKVVTKFLAGDLKQGLLSEENELRGVLTEASEFIPLTVTLAEKIIDTTATVVEMTNYQLLFLLFSMEETDYLGMLKYRNKKAFTHVVDYRDGEVVVQLAENDCILPASSAKIEEGLVISLRDFDYQLAEKNYVVDGKRIPYLSQLVLQESVSPTFKENLQVMKKAAKEIAHKFNEETFETIGNLQQAIFDTVEEEGILSKERIAEEMFPDNFEAKRIYLESVEAKGFTEDQVVENITTYEKKLATQKIKLDNEIELMIPVHLYKDPEFVEIIQNQDGTLTIQLKNIQSIKNKF